MALHVLDEANRCLGCKKPMCQEGCPIHTNIPEVIRLLKANQMDAAGRMLFENNPLTTVCSLVCNHEKQCEGHCIRNRMPSHDPVHFSIIEDYISTTYANKMTAGPAPKNGMKAAVVGSGPAGLTIAVLLARWGYDVTIFDARDKIGGVMRYGIPNYRLPDSVLDDFQYRHLELKGIKVRPNTTIGKTITIDDLFRDGYKSVFIGAGLWKANAMHIKGESLGNVAFGIDYLANSKAFRLGDDVAVIGVGNSAMDCARTAIRNGARHVTCYARRDESCISASEYEVSYAKLEGVGFRFCKAPVEIRENGLICRDTVKGEDGKFTQVEGSETLYPHTGVIVSVSQGSESNLVKTTTGIETNQKGLLSVSEDGRTTREGVFAGGDAVMGARTVVEAVAVAKKVAVAMDEYMKSLPADTAADPYADIPVFQTPTSDVLAKKVRASFYKKGLGKRRNESLFLSFNITRRVNCPSLAAKLVRPPYRSEMAQMLRTPSPWPVRSVTGTPSRNCTSGRQLLVICKNNLCPFSCPVVSIKPLPCFVRQSVQRAKVALRTGSACEMPACTVNCTPALAARSAKAEKIRFAASFSQ